MINNNFLTLPARSEKPRTEGQSSLLDSGLPLDLFRHYVSDFASLIDSIKFGWGTALATPQMWEKTRIAREYGIPYYFGGSFFELALTQNKVDGFKKYIDEYGCEIVEISNGSIDLELEEKCRFIQEFSRNFRVYSEVGYKDSQRSLELHPRKWIEFIEAELDAGSEYVITESRESGNSGICRTNGEVRFGLIEEILASSIPQRKIIFEAPSKPLQTYFIKRLGPSVNLANISFQDIVPLETLRLGLRADTLEHFHGKR